MAKQVENLFYRPCWTLPQCLLSQYWGGVLARGRYIAQVLKVLSLLNACARCKVQKDTQAHALRLVGGGRMAPKNIANACAFLHEFECGIEFDWILATCAAANQDHCCNGAALSSCSLSGEARLLLAKENLSKDSSCRSPGPFCISVFMSHGSTTIGQWLKHCASFFLA